MAHAKDGPARFRVHGDAIGRQSDIVPFGAGSQNISLATGPAVWLRLMPTVDPGRKWAVHELKEQALRGNFNLSPFLWHTLHYVRAADGFGTYAPTVQEPVEIEAASVAFAFETGEVWAIDTTLLAYTPNQIPNLEQPFIERLVAYSQFLSGLGLTPPYRWIGGLTGIMDRHLEIPTTPGHMQIVGWRGPQCLSDEIEAEGIYDGQQTPANSLHPLFKAIYDKCGVARPTFLPR